MKNSYTPKELDYFYISPRDNVADYDPIEYITIVKASAEAGKLNDYSLLELQKVEKQLSQAYTSLSNEKIGEYESTVHQMFMDIINLQNAKEDEEKKLMDDAVTFLNDIIDNYDADAPENKARKYIGSVKQDLAAGKFDKYSLAQLQEVEDKFKEAYSVLPQEEKEIYLDCSAQTIIDLTDLQDDRVEKSVESLLKDYAADPNKEIGSYVSPQVEIILEDHEVNPFQEIDLFGTMASIESLIANLPIAPQDEVSSERYPLRQGNFMSSGNMSYKAACVTSLPTKITAKIPEDKVLINDDTLSRIAVNDNSSFEGEVELNKPEEVSPASLETIIAATPKPKRNKIRNTLAKAAFVAAAAGIASLVVGYNYLSSSVQNVANSQLQHYHGSPSVEVIAPVNKAEPTEKYSRLSSEKSVETESKSVEQPAVAPQAARAKKVVMKFPRSHDIYEDNIYTIQKGNTVVGLWHDYRARGGPLSLEEYIKIFRITNSHIENPNQIFPGQEVELPN